MLELTMGGRCMGGLEAIEFFENLGDVIDEETKTAAAMADQWGSFSPTGQKG